MKKFGIPKGHKELYFTLVFALILSIIAISISVIILQEENQTNNNTQASSPTPTIQIVNPSEKSSSLLSYNKAASLKFLFRENNKTPLSSTDNQAKERILTLLPTGQNYGVVYSSNTISIIYTQALDVFNVEILTVNVALAKKEAEDWFKKEGVSQQGICNLPVGFYPSWDVANILKESDYEFNELPDGC